MVIYFCFFGKQLENFKKICFQVLAKGEITSAIYRLKITDKFAFVQSHSKLIKNDAQDNFRNKEQTNDFELQTYIHTVHSIIK